MVRIGSQPRPIAPDSTSTPIPRCPPMPVQTKGPKTPIPRCPPRFPPIKGGSKAELAKYKAQLRKMSDRELRAELSSARQGYWVATHGFAYIPEQVARAQARLNAVEAEMGRRGMKVPPSQNPIYF